ncbi:L-lactate dehydrogenase [Cetobacterium sp. SF1]|uniref:L-lactate dehydrogenase n=1 Tax=Cetobacterium sp. SF1 TaxID=3417654 RepID=UPI003CF90884
METRKVGIIGVGHVGSHCALSMILQGACDELVLVDIEKQKAKSQAIDCMDTISFLPHRTIIKDGEIEDLTNMDIIVISVGNLTADKNRLNELKGSIETIKTFVPQIVKNGFKGIFVVITNPVDIVTYYVQKLSGFPHNRVIGTGTGLDTARLRKVLSQITNLDPRSIQAFMLGEHGDSQVANFSTATVNCKPLLEYLKENEETIGKLDLEEMEHRVSQGAWDIYAGKNCTEYGIGCTCSDLVKNIFHDEKRVIACSGYLRGEYDYEGIYIGVPAIIGRNGLEKIIELPLNEREKNKFKSSCELMSKYIDMAKEY